MNPQDDDGLDDERRLDEIERQIEGRQCELDDLWLKEAWLDETERANRGHEGGGDGDQ
jgi:hypothetical protein